MSLGPIVLPGVWTPQEAEAARARAVAAGFSASPQSFSPTEQQALRYLRTNQRAAWDDPARAASLWARVGPSVPEVMPGWEAVGLNPRLRAYRYGPGDAFAPHRDGAWRPGELTRSFFTCLLYLEAGEGGETWFEGECVTPSVGAAVLFWHRLLHGSEPLLSGWKTIIRTDVVFVWRGLT